jgi:CspA family cold shock protein
MSSQLDRIESMLRALCVHLGVQANDRAGNGSQDAVDTDGHRHTGVVSRFEHGWGFIECEAMNRNFFVHYSDIEGTGMRSLDAGELVSFELAPGKDGRPKAVRVRRQSRSSPAARAARSPVFPRGEHGLPSLSAGSSSPGEVPALAAVRRGPSSIPPSGGRGLPVDEPEDMEASSEGGVLPASENRPEAP